MIERDIVGSDPADPGEVTKGLEEVAWEEVPASAANEAIEEESLSGDTTPLPYTGVLLGV